LRIKLVIKASLYYCARSEKHQNMYVCTYTHVYWNKTGISCLNINFYYPILFVSTVYGFLYIMFGEFLFFRPHVSLALCGITVNVLAYFLLQFLRMCYLSLAWNCAKLLPK
jgi:hypothetical protein